MLATCRFWGTRVRSFRLPSATGPLTFGPPPHLTRKRTDYACFSSMQKGRSQPRPSRSRYQATPVTLLTLASVFTFLSGPTAFAMPEEGLQSSTSMLQGIEDLIQAAGPAFGPVLFVVTYTASAVVLIPASLLTVAAGYLFGPVEGTILVSVASTLGATASFLVGRYIARPAVTRAVRKVPENGQKFDAIDAAITKDGVKIVALLRLSPIVPYTLLNYALSITSIPLPQYVLASWAGMLPGTVAYVALGGVGKAASGSGYSIQQIVLYSIGVAATLGASVLLSRAAKRALDEEIQSQSPPVEGDDGGR